MVRCKVCGRIIEEGEQYLDIGQGPVCEDCDYEYLKDFRHWVEEEDKAYADYINKEVDRRRGK